MSDDEIYQRVFELLRKMALMDRDGCDLDEMACKRGTASDATYLFSKDFREARILLKEIGFVV